VQPSTPRLGTALIAIGLLTVTAAPALGAPALTLCVGDVAADCDETYGTIQAAIVAADDGDTVLVAGTHDEQVTVEDSITVRGVGDATIEAPASIEADDDGENNIVLVTGEDTDATIGDLTVRGPGSSGCGSLHSGVAVKHGADATIRNVHFDEIRDQLDGNGNLSGCQNGVGVTVGQYWNNFDGDSTGFARVVDSTFTEFQKSAVTVTGDGSGAVIASNTMECFDPEHAGEMSQNAIQIWQSGAVSILENTITACNNTNPGVGGAAIHLSDGAQDVLVQNNWIAGADTGVNLIPFTYAPEDQQERLHGVKIRQNTFENNKGGVYNHADPGGEEVAIECNDFLSNEFSIINVAQLTAFGPAIGAAQGAKPANATQAVLAGAQSPQMTSVLNAPNNYYGTPAGPTVENTVLGAVNVAAYSPVAVDENPRC